MEDAKLSLARWLDQAGVVLYLQTQAVDVRMEGNRLSGIVASTPGGPRDAVLPGGGGRDRGRGALRPGGRSLYRRPDSGWAHAAGVYPVHHRWVESDFTCTHESDDTPIGGQSYLALCEEASRNGELPPDVTIVRLYGGGKPGSGWSTPPSSVG